MNKWLHAYKAYTVSVNTTSKQAIKLLIAKMSESWQPYWQPEQCVGAPDSSRSCLHVSVEPDMTCFSGRISRRLFTSIFIQTSRTAPLRVLLTNVRSSSDVGMNILKRFTRADPLDLRWPVFCDKRRALRVGGCGGAVAISDRSGLTWFLLSSFISLKPSFISVFLCKF